MPERCVHREVRCRAVLLLVALVAAAGVPARAKNEATDKFLLKVVSVLDYLQGAQKRLPNYKDKKCEYYQLDQAIAKLVAAKTIATAGGAAVPASDRSVTNSDQAIVDLKTAMVIPAATPKEEKERLQKASALLSEQTGAIKYLSDAQKTADPVLEAIAAANQLIMDAQAMLPAEPSPAPAHSDSVTQEDLTNAGASLSTASGLWSSAYPTPLPGEELPRCSGQDAAALATCVESIKKQIKTAVDEVNSTEASSGSPNAEVIKNLNEALQDITKGKATSGEKPGVVKAGTHTGLPLALLVTLLFGLGAAVALAGMLVLMPRSQPQEPGPDPGEQALNKILLGASEARRRYDALTTQYRELSSKYRKLAQENERLRAELEEPAAPAPPRASGQAPRLSGAAPAMQADKIQTDKEAGPAYSVGGASYSRVTLDSPIAASAPPTAPAVPDPLADYNRTLQMDLTEGEELFTGRYRIELLSCSNLEEHKNPNIELRFESSGTGNFMAVATAGGIQVFPSLNNNPSSARRALQGVFNYPDPIPEVLRLRAPAYLRKFQDGSYVLLKRGEFVRA